MLLVAVSANRTHSSGGMEHLCRFICVDVFDKLFCSFCLLVLNLTIWPAIIPAGPAAFASSPIKGVAVEVSSMRSTKLQMQMLKVHRPQVWLLPHRIFMTSWFAAPHIVIIHRRQIIVNKRICMHHFNCSCGKFGIGIDRTADRLAAPHKQPRSEYVCRALRVYNASPPLNSARFGAALPARRSEHRIDNLF